MTAIRCIVMLCLFSVQVHISGQPVAGLPSRDAVIQDPNAPGAGYKLPLVDGMASAAR